MSVCRCNVGITVCRSYGNSRYQIAPLGQLVSLQFQSTNSDNVMIFPVDPDGRFY